MSDKKFKYLISIGGIAFLAFHVFLILIYCTPEIAPKSKVRNLANWYIEPLLIQNWKLFAPEPPTCNRILIYRCEFKDGKWSGWNNPGRKILLKHQSNRFTYNGKLYYIYDNLARSLHAVNNEAITYFMYDSTLTAESLQHKKDSILPLYDDYKIAGRYILDNAYKQYPNEKIKAIEFRYIISYPPNFSERNNPKKHYRYKIVRFPKYVLPIQNL